jgi:aryl-alcohol dehydrogenase-like predicted oxidoreductase
MQSRELGQSGLKVSALGLGCMGMSMAYGESDEAQSIETIHHAIDHGVTFLDTAELYGNGHNEALLGRALKGRRDKVILASKFGLRLGEKGMQPVNGTPAYVKAACDASLKALGVDCIDLYYQHRVDPRTPIEDTVGAMADLVQAGKIRYLGLSEAGTATIRRAHQVHMIAAVQSEYSLWSRDVEQAVLPTCRELGIGFVAYSPFARGFLAGAISGLDQLQKPRDSRGAGSMPRYLPENFAQNKQLVDRLAAFATTRGITTAQLALAWVLAQGDDIVPIPGTRRVKRVDENIGALDVDLTPMDWQEVERICPLSAVAGPRYNDVAMAGIGL